MNTLFSILSTNKTLCRWNFLLVSLALFAGLVLSVFSWLDVCIEQCAANEEYHLFGQPFAVIGMTFFTLAIALHFLSKYYPFASQLTSWIVSSAVGAELMFIMVQKYQIGHWCPICLSIAASVALAALFLLIGYLKDLSVTFQHHNRGEIMKKIKRGLSGLSFIVLGFIMAFIGISKPDFAEAAMNDMKDRVAFGTKNSPVEVYFVSDWFCPSCKKIEPVIEKLYPKIKSQVTFYFVDYPIHKKSLNFSPYNLSFLVNNKSQYFKARQMLMDIAEKTESPRDQDIQKAANKNGISFKELSFVDIKSGLEYFDTIVEKYKLHATPTVVITNNKNKVIKLEGRDEITEAKILEAIETLNSSQGMS